MATDFWSSSQYKRWIVDRATLKQARAEDLHYAEDPEYIDFLGIFFANLISKLGKKLQLRQRAIATATVFFRRFYLKNAYCETDPFIVIAACCYVAAKAEESPVHIKSVVTEARLLFGNEEYGVKSFPSDNSKLAEMEFYLVDDLECDLVVFHPYRTLMALCSKEGSTTGLDTEAGELGVGVQDGPRYWGTGEGKLELSASALQLAWFIINDTLRSDLCLLYPPHLIAVTAIYLTLIFDSATRNSLQASQTSAPVQSQIQGSSQTNTQTRRSSRSNNHSNHRKPPQDIIGFMAGLNVNMEVIATIAQEIISLYTLWERYKEDSSDGSARASYLEQPPAFKSGLKRTASGSLRSRAALTGEGDGSPSTPRDTHRPAIVTPTFLTQLLLRMREAKMADMAHPVGGRPTAYDKRLERAQAAG